jgi:hypothetical protein
VTDGADVLDAARRARHIELVNARDHTTFITLRGVSKELQDERRGLEDARASQRQVAGDLQTQAAAIDAKLAEAARRDEIERAAAAAALTPAATSAPPTAPDTAPPSGTPSSAPPGAGAAPAPPLPAAPVNPGTPGVHPRHDDPFLACVRQRESGGNYGAVNSAGPYLGAYQFLQTTWNSTANHARRTELVGVAPNAASAYDQDDMAWTLYQWQGAGPWGGSCG